MFPKFRIGDVAYLKINAINGSLSKYEIGFIKVEIRKDGETVYYSSPDYAHELKDEKHLLARDEALKLAKEYHERELAKLEEGENEDI